MPFVPAPDTELYVGINACPSDRAMRGAVQALIDSVETLWASVSPCNWQEAHNLYTYYTVWFFGFVTGARPIVCPYHRTSEIDEQTMCGRLKDKGDDKARLFWVTDDLLAQMKNYEAYISTTRLATLIQRPCWFVNAQGSPELVREETCEPILHRFLPGFPTNVHRRWMFNALLDSACPFVPEWAGHFLTGNRLVGRGATASPSEVGHQILQYVNPIISFLGFRPILVRPQ
jgi:integrase